MGDLAAAISTGHVDRSVRELTGAIASGDTEAFGRFYRRFFDAMYADARRAAGRDEAFCLDVVHDAMLRVIRSMKAMPNEAALRCWLTRVVHSCACDRLRAEVRRRQRETSYAEREQNRTNAQSEDGNRDVAEQLDWLRSELARLDRDSADLLTLRHRFGWTLKRIASALKKHPGALHGRLGRIVAALRKRAQERFDD